MKELVDFVTTKKIRVVLPLFLMAAAALGAGFAYLPLPMFALCVLVALSVAVYRFPLLGILLVVFALPFERIGAIESSAGTIKPSQILAALTIVCWLAGVAWKRQKHFRPNPITVPLLVFLAVCIASLTQSQNVQYSAQVIALTAFTLLAGWIVPHIVTTRKALRMVVIVLLAAAAIVGAFGLFQFFGDLAGLPTSLTGLRELYTKEVFGFPRIQSTALEPLYFGNYLLIPIGLLFAYLLERRARIPLWALWPLLGLCSVNLVLTVSRGAYLAAAVEVALVLLVMWCLVLTPRILIPLVLGVAAVAWVAARSLSAGDALQLNTDTFLSHVQNVFYGASYDERVATIEQARTAFWQSPIIGIGAGGFGPYAASSPLVKPRDGWKIVNNESMELLAETGILGLLSIVTALVLLALRSVKAFLRVREDPFFAATLIGLTAALFGIVIQYQTFSTLYIMHVWFLVGLLVAVQNLILVGERS